LLGLDLNATDQTHALKLTFFPHFPVLELLSSLETHNSTNVLSSYSQTPPPIQTIVSKLSLELLKQTTHQCFGLHDRINGILFVLNVKEKLSNGNLQNG